jgi:hypothetical protein
MRERPALRTRKEEDVMRKSMLMLVGAAALVASAGPVDAVSAAPWAGTAIAKAASTNQLVQEARWHPWWRYLGPGKRRGQCLNSPAHC